MLKRSPLARKQLPKDRKGRQHRLNKDARDGNPMSQRLAGPSAKLILAVQSRFLGLRRARASMAIV